MMFGDGRGPESQAESETGRVEAFSDGVLAVIITIMALELRAPLGGSGADLRARLPALLVYILSFVFIGIYWNNHHHLLRAARRVTGGVMWANLHLLFWLSLTPFATAWMGDAHLAPVPTAVYGIVLLLAGAAFNILEYLIIASQGAHSPLRAAVGSDVKGKVSVLLYAIAITASFWLPWIAAAIYALVALMWLVPDPRIERRVGG
jgi:uncharacterized membrane protein